MRFKPPLFVQNFVKATRFWQDNRLILRELRAFPGIVALAFLFPLLAAIFEGFGIGFLLAFLQNLVNSNAEPFRTGFAWFDIYVLGIQESSLNQLYRISALILCSTWIRAIFNYLTAVYMGLARTRLVNRLYKKIFEQLQALGLSFFGQVRTGELVNVLTGEVGQLQQAINQFSFLLSKGLVLVVYAVILLTISWQLSIAAILLFTLAGAAISTLNKRIREASFPLSHARGDFSAIATELINSIRTMQAFATQDFERQRFYQASDRVADADVQAVMKFAVVRPLGESVASTILIGMIVVGMGVFAANGQLQAASLLTFIFILFRVVPAIQEINNGIASLSSFHGSVHAIEELLRRDNKPYLQNGHRRFTGLEKAIEFVSVDFSYDLGSPILHNITLSIPKGQTVALVGASGAGKSTLADLIPRFYDPTQGEIRLDGINLREFDITTVRHRMAVVSQLSLIHI